MILDPKRGKHTRGVQAYSISMTYPRMLLSNTDNLTGLQ